MANLRIRLDRVERILRETAGTEYERFQTSWSRAQEEALSETVTSVARADGLDWNARRDLGERIRAEINADIDRLFLNPIHKTSQPCCYMHSARGDQASITDTHGGLTALFFPHFAEEVLRTVVLVHRNAFARYAGEVVADRVAAGLAQVVTDFFDSLIPARRDD